MRLFASPLPKLQACVHFCEIVRKYARPASSAFPHIWRANSATIRLRTRKRAVPEIPFCCVLRSVVVLKHELSRACGSAQSHCLWIWPSVYQKRERWIKKKIDERSDLFPSYRLKISLRGVIIASFMAASAQLSTYVTSKRAKKKRHLSHRIKHNALELGHK